jgi:hypothetical protein
MLTEQWSVLNDAHRKIHAVTENGPLPPKELKQPDPIDPAVLNGVGWGTPAQQKATTVLDFDAIQG